MSLTTGSSPQSKRISTNLNNSAPASVLDPDSPQNQQLQKHRNHLLSKEVRMQAMAAVLLQEWLLELAAIAQEHSVIQKEHVLDLGMDLERTKEAVKTMQKSH